MRGTSEMPMTLECEAAGRGRRAGRTPCSALLTPADARLTACHSAKPKARAALVNPSQNHSAHLAQPLLDRPIAQRPALVVRQRLRAHGARVLGVAAHGAEGACVCVCVRCPRCVWAGHGEARKEK